MSLRIGSALLLASATVLALSVLPARGGTKDAPRKCKGSKEWYKGQCRYPDEIAELKKAEKKDRGEGKTDAKTEGKTEGKTETKTEGKTEGKTETKTEGKTEGATEAKTETKTETKTEGRVEGKTTVRQPKVRTLNGRLPDGGSVNDYFLFTPDGGRVLYVADENQRRIPELFMVDVSQPGKGVRLNQPVPSDGEVFPGFGLSHDGRFVIYRADMKGREKGELYKVSLSDPGKAVVMNRPLTDTGADISSFCPLRPDSTHLIYRGEQEKDNFYELFAVPLDDPGHPVKLSGKKKLFSSVGKHFVCHPDGRQVAYYANHEKAMRWQVYGVSVEAPAKWKRLNAVVGAFKNVDESFVFSPDGSLLLYRAPQEGLTTWELFLVALDDPGKATRVNGRLVKDGDVKEKFAFSPDGRKIVYLATQDSEKTAELYLVEVESLGASVKLSARPPFEGSITGAFAFSPDGKSVVYVGDGEQADHPELFLVSLSRPGEAVKLNAPLDRKGKVLSPLAFSPDGRQVGYLAQGDDEDLVDLFVVDLDKPGQAVRINQSAGGEGQVTSFAFSPAGGVIAYVRKSGGWGGAKALYLGELP